MIKIFLASLFLYSTCFAGLPPTTVSGINETAKATTFNLVAPNNQATTIAPVTRLIETGNGNLLVNPSFEHMNQTTGWTVTAGSGFMNLETTKIRDGKKAIAYSKVTAGGGAQVYQQVDPPATMRNQTFEYSIDVYGDTGAASILNVCVVDGVSQTQTQCQAVIRDNSYHKYTFNLVPPSSGLTGIMIDGAGANIFNFDNAYVGPARNIGIGVPNNVFSAKVSSTCTSTPCTIAGKGPSSWLTSITRTGTGAYSLNYAAPFNVAPSCQFQFRNASNNLIISAGTVSTSTTAYAFTVVNSAGTATDAQFDVTCTKLDSDFIQPAITPNQWNYDWTAANLSTTQQGFGTVTYTNAMDCRHKRQGADLLFECKFVAGTVAASEARINLPNGLTIDSTKTPAIKVVGNYFNSGATQTHGGAVLAEPGATYITFGDSGTFGVGTGGALNKVNGSGVTQNGLTVSLTARIPIQGWTENQNAPQLLGSVTSDSQSALKLEGAYVTAAGAVTEIGGSDWITQTSITPSSSTYTITFQKPFSSAPGCKATPSQTASGVISSFGVSQVTDITTTGAIVRTFNTSFLAANMPFYFECLGPR